MQFLQSVLFILAIIVALLFTLLVFVTGKGDAMSGGSSVRTTFKGKASFEDIMSKVTFILGITFMGLTLALAIIGTRTSKATKSSLPAEPPAKQAPTNPKPANEPPPSKPDTKPATTTTGN